MSPMPSPTPHKRSSYPRLLDVPTRWSDNDVYGHVNNVVYYAYFDTVINRYLIDEGGLDIHGGATIGLCVASSCAYLRPLSFPEPIVAGLRVAHLGRSSVRYDVGIFGRDGDDAAAQGEFTHVFVDRATRRPVEITGRLRDALSGIVVR